MEWTLSRNYVLRDSIQKVHEGHPISYLTGGGGSLQRVKVSGACSSGIYGALGIPQMIYTLFMAWRLDIGLTLPCNFSHARCFVPIRLLLYFRSLNYSTSILVPLETLWHSLLFFPTDVRTQSTLIPQPLGYIRKTSKDESARAKV
jgi:hypothetical protein